MNEYKKYCKWVSHKWIDGSLVISLDDEYLKSEVCINTDNPKVLKDIITLIPMYKSELESSIKLAKALGHIDDLDQHEMEQYKNLEKRYYNRLHFLIKAHYIHENLEALCNEINSHRSK